MENGKSRLKQAQEDVEQVKDIMLENLNKAEEKTGKLAELEDRADELLMKSKAFQKATGKVKQKTRWEAMKMKVILGVILALVFLVVLIVIISMISGATSGNPSPNHSTGSNTSQPNRT